MNVIARRAYPILAILLVAACDGGARTNPDAAAPGEDATTGCACDTSSGCEAACACDDDCASQVCTDTCHTAGDGECDDGGPDSLYSVCAYGTDCADCGPRPPIQCGCAGRTCGDDGCGSSCGSCDAGESCSAAGQCEACTPSCSGRECGDDGCGGTCGPGCDATESCQAGTCVACACDVTSACDAGCEACDPNCCVETFPESLATASVRGDITREEDLVEAGISTRIATYEAVFQQSDISDGGQVILALSVTDACEVVSPAPPTCNSVSVEVTDALSRRSALRIQTFEDQPSSACRDWLSRLTTETFTIRCTRGFMRYDRECDFGGYDAEITEAWTATIHH